MGSTRVDGNRLPVFDPTSSYLMTGDLLSPEQLENFNAIWAKVLQIRDPQIQKLALQAALTLLRKIKESSAEIHNAEALRGFMEQHGLGFVAHGFTVNTAGKVDFLARGFLADVAVRSAA